MIISIGVDIVENLRIKKLFYKYKLKFMKKILSDVEFNIIINKKKKIEFLSKIFSAKEAISKCLGTGIRSKIYFKNISILNNNLGRPFIKKFNNVIAIITLSHEKNITISIVYLFKM